MKINKEDIPVTMQSPGMIMRSQPNYGSMTVAFNELPKGIDIAPCSRASNGCIYIQKLEDIDTVILIKMVKNSINYFKKNIP